MNEPAGTVRTRLVDRATAVETRGSDCDVVTGLIIYLARQEGESAAMTIENSRVDGVHGGPGDVGMGKRRRS